MEYLIRPCEEKDLPRLVELCQKHAAHEQHPYDAEGKELLLSKALFSEKPSLYCLVVALGDEPQGYVSYTFDFSTWDARSFLHMDCLYLEPNIRSLGIGAIITDKLKAIARERACVNIQWQTPICNEGAIKFYYRIGATGKEKLRFFVDL